MDEFSEIATLLAKPEPSPEAVEEGRHRLQNAMLDRAPARSRRTRWLVRSLGLAPVAAAATVAIAISSSGTSPAHSPNSPPQAAPMSARQILLVAATSAEKLPDKGRYWHIRLEDHEKPGAAPDVSEHWIQRDGQVWFKGKKSDGELIQIGQQSWGLGMLQVSLSQLQTLPTQPAPLKAWLADKILHAGIRTSKGPLDAAEQRQQVFQGLVSLISLVPTTSATRAAAFRAISSYPNVKSLGRVDGGQRLEFPSDTSDKVDMVIDPATSQVRRTNTLVWLDGGEWSSSGYYVPTTGWTNTPPK